MKLDEYLEFLVETAYLAGRLTLGYFQAQTRPDYKSDNSPVTIADRLAEELIRGRIESRYPTHAILGEEFGEGDAVDSALRWIIDPIDGTKAFMRGVPLYGVLIGLEIEGEVEAGAAYFPAMGEMLAAATGLGCWWNGRRAHVSEIDDLSRAYLAFTDPGNFEKHQREAAFQRLQRSVYHRAGWNDCYGYLLAATGRVEIMLDPIMNLWDCGPFPVIFREAGGFFGDWQGAPTIYAHEALATNQALLPEIIKILHG